MDRHRLTPIVVLGWALLTPPYGGMPSNSFLRPWCADPGHLDDCAALSLWRRLGTFDDADACRRARVAGIVAAPDDETWSDWQIARCVPEERVTQGPLRPGE